MAISFRSGSNVSNAGTGVTTVAVTTTALGDLLCLGTYSGSGVHISSVAGGGATGWTAFAAPFVTQGGTSTLEIWVAAVNAVVTSTNLTVTFASSVSASTIELDTAQFTAGLGSGTNWSRDGSQQGGRSNTVSTATTITYPSLTAAAAGELYFGKAVVGSGGGGNSGTPATAGFLADTFGDPYCYGLPTASGAYQPVQNNTSTGTSDTIGVLIAASSGGGAAALPQRPRVFSQAVRRASFF